MSDTRARGRRSGGREGRRAAREHEVAEKVPFITRTLTPFEILSEEGLETIEHNADTILETVGIDFRGAPDALALLKDAGADVDGERARFPRGLARQLIQATAPREFDQYARNPENTVHLGGDATVFAPAYGSPFVRDLDGGRRYGTIEDFRNFVKLAYMTPFLHHSGGTVCEPVDLPVNKRHYDMVYAHMKYSDKPFMGSVTHPLRARDTVDMARILFGADALEERTYILSLCNAEQPARVGRHDARRGEGLRRGESSGADDPVHPCRGDVAGDLGRRGRADARRGDGGHGLRPARAARRARGVRLVRFVDVDAVGRADLRHAGAGADPLCARRVRTASGCAVPQRWIAHRLEGRGRPGGLRVREHRCSRRSWPG